MAFLIVIFYTTQKPQYSYEVELKDGSIEESFDCYEKDEKKICEIDLEKKVVVNYCTKRYKLGFWEIPMEKRIQI